MNGDTFPPELQQRINETRGVKLMSNQEILEKAIQKAVDNDWQPFRYNSELTPRIVVDWYEVDSMSGTEDNWKLFIFNHDFAKALWGEELFSEEYDSPSPRFPDAKKIDIRPIWQYHLRNMVVADDPIKYLGENL